MRGYRQDKINQILDLPKPVYVPERELPKSPNSRIKNIFRLKKSTGNVQSNMSQTQNTFNSRRTGPRLDQMTNGQSFTHMHSAYRQPVNQKATKVHRKGGSKFRSTKNFITYDTNQSPHTRTLSKPEHQKNKYSTSQGFFNRNEPSFHKRNLLSGNTELQM
jgi:hypothetical protein